jgi:hypothetical protein
VRQRERGKSSQKDVRRDKRKEESVATLLIVMEGCCKATSSSKIFWGGAH